MTWKSFGISIAVLVVGIIFGAAFRISGNENDIITLSILDTVFLILAVVSITLGIIAIVFSWMFYASSQELNRKSGEVLSDITQKISKIDDIITQHYNKLLDKVTGVKYEGAVPREDVQILKKIRITKKK